MNSIFVSDGGAGGPVQPGADAGEDVQVDLTGVQLVLQQHEEFFHPAGDPVGLVDHQGVAGLEHGEGLAQLGPVGAGAGGLDDDLAAVRAGQRVQLQLVLLGSSADAGVADADGVAVGGRIAGGAAPPGDRPGSHPGTQRGQVGCGTPCGTVSGWCRGGVGGVPQPTGATRSGPRWMPLIIGVSYLVASAVGGRTGGLWVPGLMITFWGAAHVLVLSGTWHIDFASAAITGIGIGSVLALGLVRLGVLVSPAAIAVNIALIGLLELAEAQVGGELLKGWPWALLLVVGALWELRPAVTFPRSTTVVPG